MYGAATFLGPVWNVVLGTYQLSLIPEPLLARVMSVDIGGSRLNLTAALVNSYNLLGTMVVRVPEFTTVTINSGALVITSSSPVVRSRLTTCQIGNVAL